MNRIFLDYQASTPVASEVRSAMEPFLGDAFGNPSSLHQEGLRVREAVERARDEVARWIDADPAEIVFTSDGTESVNLAVLGAARASSLIGRHIVAGTIEHPAVMRSLSLLEGEGFEVTRVGVDGEGRLDPAAIEAALTDRTTLIVSHLVHHDLGTIQEAARVGRVAAERGLGYFVDCEAAAGWHPVSARELGATLLSFSPHRFHGPKGIGVLYRGRRTRLVPLLLAGDQEGGMRAGVLNVAGVVGAGVACRLAGERGDAWRRHVQGLQKRLWNGLRDRIRGLRLLGPPPGAGRVGTLLNLCVEGIDGEGLVLTADLKGIALASGSSCLSRVLGPSYVLNEIGVPADLARGNVLLSLGRDNTPDEIEEVIERLPPIVERLRGMTPGSFQASSG